MPLILFLRICPVIYEPFWILKHFYEKAFLNTYQELFAYLRIVCWFWESWLMVVKIYSEWWVGKGQKGQSFHAGSESDPFEPLPPVPTTFLRQRDTLVHSQSRTLHTLITLFIPFFLEPGTLQRKFVTLICKPSSVSWSEMGKALSSKTANGKGPRATGHATMLDYLWKTIISGFAWLLLQTGC